MDSVLLRYNPELALKNAIAKLGFTSDKLTKLDLNNLAKAESKVWDIRDKSRPMVRKANNSKKIETLTVKEVVDLDIFPTKSQQHIKELIPLYLDFLYAPEQAYLPSLAALETKLITTNPFIAYAIALFHLQDPERAKNWLRSVTQGKSTDNQNSLAIVDNYWEKTQRI